MNPERWIQLASIRAGSLLTNNAWTTSAIINRGLKIAVIGCSETMWSTERLRHSPRSQYNIVSSRGRRRHEDEAGCAKSVTPLSGKNVPFNTVSHFKSIFSDWRSSGTSKGSWKRNRTKQSVITENACESRRLIWPRAACLTPELLPPLSKPSIWHSALWGPVDSYLASCTTLTQYSQIDT